MDHDDAVYLRQIIDAIEQIERYIRGMSESEFASRPMVQDAVVRRIEIISEAATNISDEFQRQHAKFPWAKIIGIRKKIIPGRFEADLTCVWNTVQDDLPLHKQAIKKLL
jgi:uncharacterized protein with HEPN domain